MPYHSHHPEHKYGDIFSQDADSFRLYFKNVEYVKPKSVDRCISMLKKYNITSQIDERDAVQAIVRNVEKTAKISFHDALHCSTIEFAQFLFKSSLISEHKLTHLTKNRRDRQSTDYETQTRAAGFLSFLAEKIGTDADASSCGAHRINKDFSRNLNKCNELLEKRPDLTKLIDPTLSKLLLLSFDTKGGLDVKKEVCNMYKLILNKTSCKQMKKAKSVDLLSNKKDPETFLIYSMLILDELCVNFLKKVNAGLDKDSSKYSIYPVFNQAVACKGSLTDFSTKVDNHRYAPTGDDLEPITTLQYGMVDVESDFHKRKCNHKSKCKCHR